MHIKRIQIQNIRCIKSLDWQVDEEQLAGWHVVLGDNGSGKSTFLRAVAVTLSTLRDIYFIRRLMGEDAQKSEIIVDFKYDDTYDEVIISGQSGQYSIPKQFRLSLEKELHIVGNTVGRSFKGSIPEKIHGLFSAGYGPFRRFTGGELKEEGLGPRQAAHLSLFSKEFTAFESLSWLKILRFKQLEGRPEGQLLDSIINFINQSGFLPNNCYLDQISSDSVHFRDGNGYLLPAQDLSDGYDSILSLTFDIIRQLTLIYQTNEIFDPEDPTKIIMPGVVLIDEIDAHLHPTWQRQIGQWFRSHFPKIQFIVTTHSPLICQAATVGSIYKLPQPGTDEQGRMLTGQERDRLLYGNVLDAYSTEAFGLTVNRSEEAQNRLQRLAELNQKELFSGLTAQETQEQAQLRAMMPTSAHQTS